ncbi:carbohydrate ABC transporter permease [Paenibacillus sp. FSL H7-0331]|uniref:carbohydrate ABC transporter permease n=1 Tax=Paenibacillus sp. FSL H7-0331 TaxID=1920421 RepID=UPI002116C5AD|nr:carbohydrate ABC transporter permease [Paenibacillus sp. FSL H7-0331]
MMQNRTFGVRMFQAVNGLFLTALMALTLYPFVHLLSVSLSEGAEASRIGLHLWPRSLDWVAYREVLISELTWIGYRNTVLRTVIGTALTAAMTAMTAYPLAKAYFPLRRTWIVLIVFTMIFSGGLVPNYLLIKELGLLNSLWALILPGLISPFSLLIVRNFFQSIPVSLEESARIDGASELTVMRRIVLPLSMPVMATIALWTAVGHWNAFFDAILYMTDKNKLVLQVILRKIILEHQMIGQYDGAGLNMRTAQEAVEAATIIVSTLPILIVYPFLQKHFVKGVMLGSIKG